MANTKKNKCKSQGGISHMYISDSIESIQFNDAPIINNNHTITFSTNKLSKQEIESYKKIKESMINSCMVLVSDREPFCVKHNRIYNECIELNKSNNGKA